MPQLLPVTGIKVKETTGLYKGYYRTEIYKNGELFVIFPAGQRQPRKSQKTVNINCFKWSLTWPENN